MTLFLRVLPLLLLFLAPRAFSTARAQANTAVSTNKPAKPAPSAPVTTHDSALLSPPPAPGSTARGSDPSVREMANPTEHSKDRRHPMGWLGISVKLGVASVAVGKAKNPVYNRTIADFVRARNFTPAMLEQYGLDSRQSCSIVEEYCQTSGRTGFQLALTLHVGGDGFGWDAEPYLRAGGNAVSVGVYSGPKFDIHAAEPFYFGFGFGARAGYVSAEGWVHGLEIFGRIPVHATYYIKPDFALTMEGSFGAGVSGFMAESTPIRDPRTERTIATTPKIAFGAARSWDLTIGVRFP
jgi:hypothetical protein